MNIYSSIQQFLESITETEKNIYFNLLLMTVSVVATFLSANTQLNKIKKSIIIYILLIVVLTSTIIIYGISGKKFFVALFLLIGAFVLNYVVITSSNRVSRRKIDKMIRTFTQQAECHKDIKLFGGDLDFLGNVEDGSINNNKQLIQLEYMKFDSIKVLCKKPIINNEGDILRIGFLADKFKSKIMIRFFIDNKCDDCCHKEECFYCKVCEKCAVSPCSIKKKCNIITGQTSCPTLVKYKKLSCNNPDIDIRGRIITKSSSRTEIVAIFNKIVAGKRYLIREYNSEDKECRIYTDIWKIWWERCEIDDKFIEECKSKYLDYKSNSLMTQNKRRLYQRLFIKGKKWIEHIQVR